MENTVNDNKKRLLPLYSIIPMVTIVIAHVTVYFGTKLINGSMPHSSPAVAVDTWIPFAPEWVIIYVLTFFFWAAGLVYIAIQDDKLCYKFTMSVLVGELACGIIFILMPTVISRPQVIGDLYYHRLMEYVFANDVPTNLFPSMHCMMSYMVFRMIVVSPKSSLPYKIGSGILTVLICASTLFVKQHFFPDVISGLIFGEVAMLIGQKTNLWKIFIRLNKKIVAKPPVV